MMVSIPIGVGLLCLVLISQIVRYFVSLKVKDVKREEIDGGIL
jgi:hypothetical protein